MNRQFASRDWADARNIPILSVRRIEKAEKHAGNEEENNVLSNEWNEANRKGQKKKDNSLFAVVLNER